MMTVNNKQDEVMVKHILIYFIMNLGGTFNTVSGTAEFDSIDSCKAASNRMTNRVKFMRGKYFKKDDVNIMCIKK